NHNTFVTKETVMSNHFTKLWKRGLALLLAGVLSLSNLSGALAFAESTPPQESAVAATAETAATPETALSPEAQVFVDAVNALDRESILAAVRQWAIACAE